jgi:hypothetical protein
MADLSDKYVRFYFGVSISCLIPPNPGPHESGGILGPWPKRCLERLRADIEAKISEAGFEVLEVAYRKHATIDGALRLYAADFVVSVLHLFPALSSSLLGRGSPASKLGQTLSPK